MAEFCCDVFADFLPDKDPREVYIKATRVRPEPGVGIKIKSLSIGRISLPFPSSFFLSVDERMSLGNPGNLPPMKPLTEEEYHEFFEFF